MADSQVASLCLVGAMDRLWFHHPILFTEPCLKSPSSKSSLSDSEEMLPVSAPVALLQIKAETDEETKEERLDEDVSRQTGTSQATRIARSKSHSPKTERKSKIVIKDINTTSSKRLDKINSSKTYADLEQEEVKGFIDLGFRFKREHISPKMICVVPGLQRIIRSPTSSFTTSPQYLKSDAELVTKPEIEYLNNVEGCATTRPYLSEAWLIKRPDSPLLNMRVRRGHAAADMKKQLKFWARTVASETRQES
ncbi:unnamed protein product [Rhodiola kirilowii]